MEEWTKLKAMSDAKKRAAEKSKQNYMVESRRRLSTIAQKKLKTAFIGAIAEFEKQFGYLWGFKATSQDGRPLSYTREQMDMKDCLLADGYDEEYFKQLWAESREVIFNKGMNQSRALDQEIGQYEISWNKYTLELNVEE